MRGRILISAIIFVASVPVVLRADRSQPIYLVDRPTAGILANGEYVFSGRMGPKSSMLFGIRIGFREVLQLGASFGMQRLFDRGDVEVNDKVGFRLRIRLLEEYVAPALAIGFDSQGTGFYHEQEERYDRKSPGFYVVLSKNYMLAVGDLSLHGGVNYSTEDKDDDDPNVFFGTEWRVVEKLGFLLDADAALNDNGENNPFGKGGIYLDAAVRLDYGRNLSLMFIFRDLTGNFRPESGVGREFEIAFWDSF